MPRIIPIRLGHRRTNQDTKFVDCPPVTEVHVSVESGWNSASGITPKHNGLLYPALVDTGAESTTISTELAAQIGCSPTSKATMHGFGGTQEVQSADIHIVIPSQNIVFSCRAAISPLGLAGHTFAVVLGRSFLQHCRLEVDGPRNEYRLWWLS